MDTGRGLATGSAAWYLLVARKYMLQAFKLEWN